MQKPEYDENDPRDEAEFLVPLNEKMVKRRFMNCRPCKKWVRKGSKNCTNDWEKHLTSKKHIKNVQSKPARVSDITQASSSSLPRKRKERDVSMQKPARVSKSINENIKKRKYDDDKKFEQEVIRSPNDEQEINDHVEEMRHLKEIQSKIEEWHNKYFEKELIQSPNLLSDSDTEVETEKINVEHTYYDDEEIEIILEKASVGDKLIKQSNNQLGTIIYEVILKDGQKDLRFLHDYNDLLYL